MITKRTKWALRIAVISVVSIILALIAVNPESRIDRKYPEREPVVFWHMWSAKWKDVVDRIVDKFNESQDVYEVVPLSIPSGADTKFLLSVAGGDPPDVMAQWNPVIPVWAERGALLPLDSMMSSQELDRFKSSIFPIIWNIGEYKDHFYGLCVGANIRALYYRPSHFKAAGLDPNSPPRTISELDSMADKLTKVDAQGRILRLGNLPVSLSSWAPSFGGGFFDAENRKLVLRSPQNRKTLEWIRSYIVKYGPDEVTRFTSSLQAGASGGLDWPFINGAYSITMDGQWRVEQLAQYAPDLDYNTAPLPMADEGGVENAGMCNGNFLIIPSEAKCPDGAWAFMRYWSGIDNPDVSAEFYTWGGWLPVSREIVEAPAYRAYIEKYPQFKTFVDIISNGNLQVYPPVTYQSYFASRLWQMELGIRRLSFSVEEGLEKVEKEMQREEKRLSEWN